MPAKLIDHLTRYWNIIEQRKGIVKKKLINIVEIQTILLFPLPINILIRREERFEYLVINPQFPVFPDFCT